MKSSHPILWGEGENEKYGILVQLLKLKLLILLILFDGN